MYIISNGHVYPSPPFAAGWLMWSLLSAPQLKSLSLPDCWIRDFFLAHMYTELQMIKEALQKYQSLIEAGFSKSTYVISQIAVAYHNIRGLKGLCPSLPLVCPARSIRW